MMSDMSLGSLLQLRDILVHPIFSLNVINSGIDKELSTMKIQTPRQIVVIKALFLFLANVLINSSFYQLYDGSEHLPIKLKS